jgi:hypothetical protein
MAKRTEQNIVEWMEQHSRLVQQATAELRVTSQRLQHLLSSIKMFRAGWYIRLRWMDFWVPILIFAASQIVWFFPWIGASISSSV